MSQIRENLNSQQVWYNIILTLLGSQDLADSQGFIVKKYDPAVTGRFNYEQRAQIEKDRPPNYGQIELPKSLKSSHKRVYSPQTFLLDGYAQCPSPISKPYQNQSTVLKRDFIKKRTSADCEINTQQNAVYIKNKWNKNLVKNTLENTFFQNNNVGVSHLTSPANYTQDETIMQMMKQRKEFLLQSVEKYREKIKSVSLVRPESPSDEPVKISKPTSKQIRLDALNDTFQNNIPGETINGRTVMKPVYKLRKTILQPLNDSSISAPLTRLSQTIRNNSSPPVLDYQENSTQQSNILSLNANQTTAATSRVMNSIDLSDTNIHHSSLIQSLGNNDSNKRSTSMMNYESLKQKKIKFLTNKSPRYNDSGLEDDSSSLSPSKIQGTIPNYSIKQGYRKKVKPFFLQQSQVVSSKTLDGQDALNEYLKQKDPSQQLKFLDQIQVQYDQLLNLEQLEQKSKVGSTLMYKFKTEQAILDKLEEQQDEIEKKKTKGRFQVQLPNTSDIWRIDRQWQMKSNPLAAQEEIRRDTIDRKILEKRRNQRVLKNLAMEQQYKIPMNKAREMNNHI
ncbi:UNKNOWN [Stylonychia lemnae]|uniref:Uncharacterized protein n=1 Tax=Stylonychia lemnae TaxID=5949 RepID=A0A078ALR7_STYLE|nr:UNKNOWN [Stylonychia lemnae]|eukprot:CDW83295.1 UNKNOWN [Stylonychia lemnae]